MFSRGAGDTTEIPANLFGLLEYHAARYGSSNTLFAKHGNSWQGFASRDLPEIVRRTALGLYALGVRPGHRVAILAENSPLWVISDFSITALGAATVPLYTTQIAAQIQYILEFTCFKQRIAHT